MGQERYVMELDMVTRLRLFMQFPTLMEAIGMNYHHLDVNIGIIIVPGPTVGRDYAYFEEIARDSRASFLRAQVRERGGAPSVLCAHADGGARVSGHGWMHSQGHTDGARPTRHDACR